jgi:hypothetical protein
MGERRFRVEINNRQFTCADIQDCVGIGLRGQEDIAYMMSYCQTVLLNALLSRSVFDQVTDLI